MYSKLPLNLSKRREKKSRIIIAQSATKLMKTTTSIRFLQTSIDEKFSDELMINDLCFNIMHPLDTQVKIFYLIINMRK